MGKLSVRGEILPGIVDQSILRLAANNPPFIKIKQDIIYCGYFGGLSVDKGAAFLLELINEAFSCDLPIRWIVTGNGEFADSFKALSDANPNKFMFYGTVDHEKLIELIASVDVMVNPHLHNTGVFPFKVLEAVASGRLVISTPLDLPYEMAWLKNSVVESSLDVQVWLDFICNSNKKYYSMSSGIKTAGEVIEAEYSVSSLQVKILSVIKGLVNSAAVT